MSTLQWNRPKDQTFESGLDRGVIYLETGKAVAWSGLTNVSDSGSSEVKELYIDGQKYLATISPRDWSGSLEAYTYPEEFAELLGILELGDGLYVDSQLPGRFNLSYRTMVSSPNLSDPTQHYKIHLIYKVMASVSGDISYETLSDGASDPSSFSFDLTAVPQAIPNARPTAHIILDTRKLDAVTRGTLEGMLYGNGYRDPEFPTISELTDMLTFGGRVVVVDNHDGTWTATGSNSNIIMVDDSLFEIHNVAANYLSDTVYEFFGVGDSDAVRFVLAEDTDGVPYYKLGEGVTNVNLDTDGVLYFGAGEYGANLAEDEDGQLYFFFT